MSYGLIPTPSSIIIEGPALLVGSRVMYGTVWIVTAAGGGPVAATILAVPAACLGFRLSLGVVFEQARVVFRRTYELSSRQLCIRVE